MKRALLLLFAATPLLSTPLSAQRRGDATIAYRSARTPEAKRVALQAEPTQGTHVARILTGALGFVGGALLGGAILSSREEYAEDEFYAFLTGMIFGAPIGAVIGVAEPRFGSSCSDSKRYVRATLGVLGGSAGVLGLAAVTDDGAILAAPVLVPLVGALALGSC